MADLLVNCVKSVDYQSFYTHLAHKSHGGEEKTDTQNYI